jgi:hypothetical protein
MYSATDNRNPTVGASHAVAAFVALAIYLYIRRRRSAKRQVETEHVYGSNASTPIGPTQFSWFKPKILLERASRARAHDREVHAHETPPEIGGAAHLFPRSCAGSEESGRVKSALHKVISLGTGSSHPTGSRDGQSKNGNSSTVVVDSPAWDPTGMSQTTLVGGMPKPCQLPALLQYQICLFILP